MTFLSSQGVTLGVAVTWLAPQAVACLGIPPPPPCPPTALPAPLPHTAPLPTSGRIPMATPRVCTVILFIMPVSQHRHSVFVIFLSLFFKFLKECCRSFFQTVRAKIFKLGMSVALVVKLIITFGIQMFKIMQIRHILTF